jgi:hypothetical protein
MLAVFARGQKGPEVRTDAIRNDSRFAAGAINPTPLTLRIAWECEQTRLLVCLLKSLGRSDSGALLRSSARSFKDSQLNEQD